MTPDASRWDVNDSLDELAELASTAGAVVTDRMTQSLSRVNPTTYIGTGKVAELKNLIGARGSDLVIFDDDLSPVQVRNLEKALDCKLLDRSALILDIFATRGPLDGRADPGRTGAARLSQDAPYAALDPPFPPEGRHRHEGTGRNADRDRPPAHREPDRRPQGAAGEDRPAAHPSSARDAKGLPASRWSDTRTRASPP